MKFKIGDRVECINRDSFNLTIGKIYTITGMEYTNKRIGIRDDNDHCFFYRASLFIPAKAELDELIEKANEGSKAIEKMHKEYPKQFEYSHAGIDEWSFATENSLDICEHLKYRKKKTPVFESFTVGDDWKVSIKDESIKIGCKYFNAIDVFHALNALCVDKWSITDVSNLYWQPNRTGIKDSNGNHITWNDADKILNALKKVGYKR